MYRSGIIALFVLLALALGACGSSSTDASDDAGAASGTTSASDEAGAEATESPVDGGGGGSGGAGGDVPTISTRFFAGGSAQVAVSGMFEIDADVAINTGASYADGGYTWLQYGDSGSKAPNALITVGEGEIGVTVGLGTYTAIVTSADCPGELDVTGTKISGHFKCTGVAGYNSGDQAMGTVDLEVTFTADS
jgi:hypothetical protein